MIKDWTHERKEQLQKLQELLSKTEVVNRTTGSITDILKCSEIANDLLYSYSDSDGRTFWSFLIGELNKDAS